MWRLALVVGVVRVFGSRSALAAEEPCVAPLVEADPNVRSRFPRLPGHIRQALAARRDIDTCARVTLTEREGRIAMVVALPDGRVTSRSVSRREDVLPTIEALLLVPRPSQPEPEPEPESESEPALAPEPEPQLLAPPTLTIVATPNRDAAPRPPGDSAARMRLELSIATGARVGDGQTSIGVGLLSFIDVAGWLAGFGGRADYFHAIDGAPPGAALSLAALGGRRFRIHSLALDFFGGPALSLQGMSRSVVEGPPPLGRRVTESDQGASARMVLGTRLNFRARSTLRTFVGVDGDVALSSNDARTSSDVHRLPAWTAGLVLGATVGTL